MTAEIQQALERLANAGWSVEFQPERRSIRAEVLRRYEWMPLELLDFFCEVKQVCSPDERAWFLTGENFNESDGFAFAWNEWERLSLDAAQEDDDEAWAQEIREFWDGRLPIFTSVKSGYAYFAMDKTSREVVQGEEPVFEESSRIAGSFAELLGMLAEEGGQFERWV